MSTPLGQDQQGLVCECSDFVDEMAEISDWHRDFGRFPAMGKVGSCASLKKSVYLPW